MGVPQGPPRALRHLAAGLSSAWPGPSLRLPLAKGASVGRQSFSFGDGKPQRGLPGEGCFCPSLVSTICSLSFSLPPPPSASPYPAPWERGGGCWR
eukprot:10415571-Heterocapsa_arctica.AAC.1